MLNFLRITPSKRSLKISRGKGVIYSNPSGGKRGIFYLGNLMVMIGVGYGIYLYYPLARVVLNYYRDTPVVQYQPKTTPTKIPMAFPTRVAVITPTLSPNPERLAAEPLRIEIPKIKATAKIVENVSPYDRGEYLKVLNTNAVAMASGSSRPGNGLGKSTYIFAHSSSQGLQAVRNNPVFYLLGKLRNDDEVTITDGESSYRYKIYDKKIIAADNIEYLSYSDPEREVVILQTCWPIGTDWKRLLVFGERI